MPKALTPRAGGKASRAAAQQSDAAARRRSRRSGASRRPTEAAGRRLSRLARAIELLERGDAGAAVTEAEKAKRLAPRSAAVREVLGLALYGQERWQEALTELKAYKRMTGRADQNHLIADCLRGLGRPAEASRSPTRSCGPRASRTRRRPRR